MYLNLKNEDKDIFLGLKGIEGGEKETSELSFRGR